MTIYLSDRTGSSIDSILDNADAGNIGRDTVTAELDLNTLTLAGFYTAGPGTSNTPAVSTNHAVGHFPFSATNWMQLSCDVLRDDYYIRNNNSGSVQPWRELYHTGNTGPWIFDDADGVAGADSTTFGSTLGFISIARNTTASANIMTFVNPNGKVGSIATAGSATSFNTSSDPRLKNFKELPSDLLIDTEFNNMFDCFRVFNWKSEPDGDLVWGFDAHQCIDNKTNIGSEGEGPRNLELGDVYETTPAVTENRVVMDAEGNPTNEIEEVVITKAIEHKVTPAGVDQSKAVPILLAKIEQLERRLTAAGL